ncbi:MAG: hypothetical protein HYR64_06100 [Fimbriimonas ginsengisoli]|uniref:Uncharacterized protein n=1 Tax=Fimbriimonas ginsengisoli TaxID=1005039 RepID=A0A931LV01_FIMGI|nr:hypothetical protein [Fimbriimonas ginsengisoli]
MGESIVAKCATEPRFTLTIRKLDERQWALTEFHNSSIAAEMELEGFRDEGTSTGLSGPGVTYGRRIPSKGLDVFVWFCLTDGGLIRGDAVGPSDTQAQLQILFEAGRMVGGIRKFVRGQQADRVGVPEHRA